MQKLLLLFALWLVGLTGCAEKVVYEEAEFVPSYHVKLIVNGELVTQWESDGPAWSDAHWKCLFIDKSSGQLIRLLTTEVKEGTNPAAVVVTSRDQVKPTPHPANPYTYGW